MRQAAAATCSLTSQSKIYSLMKHCRASAAKNPSAADIRTLRVARSLRSRAGRGVRQSESARIQWSLTGAASSSACNKGSAASAARPSAPNNVGLGNRVGPTLVGAQDAAGNSRVKHYQTECGPAKLVWDGPRFGNGGCKCGADPGVVGHESCARGAVGKGLFDHPRRRTLESAHSELHRVRRFAARQKNHRQVVQNVLGFWLEGQGATEAFLRCVEMPESAKHSTQCAVRSSIVGPQVDCHAQPFGCLLMALLSHCKYTQIEMSAGIAWIDGKRALVTIPGFGAAPETVERVTPRHERIREVGLDVDGSLVVVQSTLVSTSAIVEVSQIEVGCRVVRIAGYCKFVRTASLIDPGTGKQNVAAVQVGPRASRIRLDGSIVTRHSLSGRPCSSRALPSSISAIAVDDKIAHRCISGSPCGS